MLSYFLRSVLPTLLLLLHPAASCFIQNQDSGYCAKTSNIESVLPFCGKYVKVYPSVCLPKEYTYFPNSTAKTKDAWVQGQSTSTISRRSEVEKENGYGVTLLPYDGKAGSILVHFYKNADCQEAYNKYLCYMNFPRCDDAQNSLLLCDTACQSFFRACRYPYSTNDNNSMWRCGPAAFLGGGDGEPPASIDAKGNPVYARSLFPGLPFAPYAPGACTPGVPGGAGATTLALAAALLALALSILTVVAP